MLDEVLEIYKPITDLENKIKMLEEKLKVETSDAIIKEYSNARERYEIMGGYTYKKEYQTMIRKFGFSKEEESKKISEFSGGQKTRIAFIKLLISKPDILLLDEPTNHLDIETIEWLETYLKNYPKAIVVVSHDRMFLNKIVNKVYEIEYASITEYTGNYTQFEIQKKANYEKQLKDFEYQQKEIKRLTQIADRFRYKPTKAKMALSKLKQIERMVKVEEPNRYDLKTFHANFVLKKQSGKVVLSVKDLEIGYDKVLAKLNFNVMKGQKLGIIGANGIGKSTLLKTLTKMIKPLGGTFELGYNVDLQYFDQDLAFSNNKKTIFDEFADKFPGLNDREVRSALATFLFTGEDVFKEIDVLSGGEKVRLKLCEIFKKGPNLMLLDEPTNHMDILGKESLERILSEYEGTLIFVSHDRYFVSKIADSLLIFEKDKVVYFDGNYDEYIEKREIEQENLIADNDNKTKKADNVKPNGKALIESNNDTKDVSKVNEYVLRKERTKIENKIKKMEERIINIEEEINTISREMATPENAADYIKLTELQKDLQEKEKELDAKMLEWSELEEDLKNISKK